MVKLQRVLAYSRKDKQGNVREHFKNFVNLPDEAIEKLGWVKGEELDWIIERENLILRPVKPVRAVRRVE